jgi:hypothetical protein
VIVDNKNSLKLVQNLAKAQLLESPHQHVGVQASSSISSTIESMDALKQTIAVSVIPKLSTLLVIPLSMLNNTTLDLTPYATPCRYRLIDGRRFVDENVLHIVDIETIPTRKYAAISYPWQRLSPLEAPPTGEFTVNSAELGGPISIDLLATCCRAALLENCELLWLDRLCIMLTSRNDKN